MCIYIKMCIHMCTGLCAVVENGVAMEECISVFDKLEVCIHIYY